jgi:branched-chain amino acid transport system permease protein
MAADLDVRPSHAATPTHRPGPLGLGARAVVIVLLAAVVIWLPLTHAKLFGVHNSQPEYSELFANAAIYAMVGLSLNVLIGYAGQLSLGHQGFLGLGAITAANITTKQGLPLPFGLLVGVAVAGLFALVLGAVALRISGLYLALVTLVFGLTVSASVFELKSLTNRGQGQAADRPSYIFTDQKFYVLCLVLLLAVYYLDYRLTKSKSGRALLALKENERVAEAFGINVTAFKLLAFVMSGAICGLAGGLFVFQSQQFATPTYSFPLALTFVVMAVVGGVGSRAGVVIGSAFYAVLEPLLSFLFRISETVLKHIPVLKDYYGSKYPYFPTLIGGLLLVLTLVFNPGGIAQQIKPIGRWLRGQKFSLHDPDADTGPGAVEGSSVRA